MDESFPAFTVHDTYNVTSNTTSSGWELQQKINDYTIWKPYFLQKKGNETDKVEAKLCKDVLFARLDKDKAKSIINDNGDKKDFLCPDSDSFIVGLNSSSNFTFNLEIVDGRESVFQQADFVSSKVLYTQISAYFNPKKYRESKSLRHVDFIKEIYVNSIDNMQDLTIPIYLDHIKYYGERFWDTSTLLGFDWLFLDEENTYYTENIK